MAHASLQEAERIAVRRAYNLGKEITQERVTEYSGLPGAFVAVAGGERLFSAGGEGPFKQLWEQAMTLKPLELTPQQIAVKLYAVMSKTPHGVLHLLRKAEIEEEYLDLAKKILVKLTDAGKCQAVQVRGKVRYSR